MKKFIVLAIAFAMLFSLVGCSQSKKAEQLQSFYDENWESEQGVYEKDVLPTKEAAEAVAQQIFDSLKEKYGKEEWVLRYTTYYEAQNAWMVAFFDPPTEGSMSKMGESWVFALNKTTGRLMRILP